MSVELSIGIFGFLFGVFVALLLMANMDTNVYTAKICDKDGHFQTANDRYECSKVITKK